MTDPFSDSEFADMGLGEPEYYGRDPDLEILDMMRQTMEWDERHAAQEQLHQAADEFLGGMGEIVEDV